MSPDELRALAEALEPMAKAPRFADFDVPGFCAWVRACADEKPVGVYVHRPAELRYGVEWLVGDPMPNGTQLFTHPAPTEPQADAQPVAWSDGLGSFIAADERVGDDPDILAYRVPLYTHPAPAAPPPLQNTVPLDSLLRRNERDPQRAALMAEARLAAAPAAPQAMEDANVWKQIVPDDEPQAEPKREPLTDAILAACKGTKERAAKACEALAFLESNSHWSDGFNTAIERCAAAIRAMGSNT